MKIDPYKHKEKFLSWKEKVKNGIPGISKQNSATILHYISDMENGLNVSSIRSQGALRLFSLHNAEYMIWKMTHMQICRYPDRIEICIEALEAHRREEKAARIGQNDAGIVLVV